MSRSVALGEEVAVYDWKKGIGGVGVAEMREGGGGDIERKKWKEEEKKTNGILLKI